MTAPAPETIEREKDKLFITDAELIRWLGIPERNAREAIDYLEINGTFPRKQPMFANRRYRKAVEAWLDKYCMR